MWLLIQRKDPAIDTSVASSYFEIDAQDPWKRFVKCSSIAAVRDLAQTQPSLPWLD